MPAQKKHANCVLCGGIAGSIPAIPHLLPYLRPAGTPIKV